MHPLSIKKASNNNYLIINTKLTAETLTFFQKFAGFTKWKERDFWVRITPQNLEYLMDNWDGDFILSDPETKEIFSEYERILEEKKKLLEAKSREVAYLGGYKFKRSPMKHQAKGFAISKDLPEYALFFEQGLGKTKVIIDNAAYLYEKDEIDMLVVIAWPNGLHINWTEWEIPEDLPDRIKSESFFWKSSLTKKKIKRMEEVITGEGFLKIASFNVEAFSSNKAREWLLKCLENNRCMLVIDQSASIKNPVAKRTKFLIKQAASMAKYRRILDGAPVAENAAELFSQFYFLDWKIIGCDTFTSFKNEFCIIGRFNQVEGYTNIDKLMKRIEPYYMRALEEECLDLPKRVYKRFPFELSKEERRIYNDISSKKLSHFEGETLETPLAITKSIRLQQISSGWWAGEQGATPIAPKGEHPSRLKALLVLLKQLEGKTIIFGRFKADMRLIESVLDNCVGYHGDTNQEEREENKKAFQLGDAKYLVGNPATAGIGHTFTAAKNIVFYSNEYSLRFRLESEKRVHRKGQTETVHIYDLVAEKTQDSKIISALMSKKEVADMILNDPDNFFLEEST
jgi:SNF2 family DNA or RNA helicase